MSFNSRLNTKAYYPGLNSLFFSYRLTVKKYEEMQFNDLANLAREAVIKKDYKKANEYAVASIINYGVPGFILHHEVNMQSLSDNQKAGELIEQEVSNSLTYLLLAEILFKKDPRVKTLMQQNMKEEKISESDYFKTKQNKLMKLYQLDENIISECKHTAEELANKAIPTSTPETGNYLKK
ncbi:MAG: hypothetical protein P4M12_04970 [Gammaproteobacteria bacterium]|nr:hypothetical protein [Gammaproteobacteria bacterium]